MPHKIEIDDEVYRELERHVKGFESPNNVLRRLLLGDKISTTHSEASIRTPGKLLVLLEAGQIHAHDTLTHHQPRKHRTFTATVEDHGWIRTEKDMYNNPSRALADLVGSQIDGWANWVHEPSGRTLGQLRDSPK
ncbi:hypothetical protein GR168_23030 (plasmid) [Gordonia sp. JH63]|uniref:restriction system modified-DNA reader domain-containing protein n=1 Tax=Gordonia sp. JH63 TaxID=2698900 RepID=UPI00131FE239|nr:hypothetical protein [Gordonia sp. JH63]QHD88377.1 hypothetical protein GR168_23030 [Gordonia sp. JH63]